VSAEAKDLIERLICDHRDRLGNNSVDEIRAHPFFHGIDWDTIMSTATPWKPQLKSPTDTSCFDEVPQSPDPPGAGNFFFCPLDCVFCLLKQGYPGATSPDDNLTFYGFTFRGFYNLTRERTTDGDMDPLQSGVLQLLGDDDDQAAADAAADGAVEDHHRRTSSL